ncbi:4'-phosphopantetheinyl transferase superfamily protein [Mesonia sp. MT50]|uniref:4'-phosphopantetheinyl transferase superfamily protein n=1 Tax=Mesonia profundi TaxID=3070998 RepID=A0ABU1A414_9FLAO|nr:4'-phosphopantetheinyl transferase superfamily protein [Mesonia profundi]MDQ7918421.1 4'-phosphopantetheinyl transferase superfamily protein [Mesonia profundi]
MIGNDVVDLSLAKKQSNWQRPRFIEKIFTKQEQTEINSAKDPDFLVWLFWSMKESAYKAHQRIENFSPRFNPWQLECSLQEVSAEKIIGKVNLGASSFYTSSTYADNCIFTSAASEKNLQIFHQKVANKSLKEELLKSISEKEQILLKELHIIKNENQIPQLYQLENLLDIPFSISHHGDKSAFVLLNKKTAYLKINGF